MPKSLGGRVILPIASPQSLAAQVTGFQDDLPRLDAGRDWVAPSDRAVQGMPREHEAVIAIENGKDPAEGVPARRFGYGEQHSLGQRGETRQFCGLLSRPIAV